MAITGQSNAWAPLLGGTPPVYATLYRDAFGGASIEEPVSEPGAAHYWREGSPACLALGAFFAAGAAAQVPVNVWVQGESALDGGAANPNYGTDLQGVIEHIDAVSGKSPTWVVVLLNSLSTAGPPAEVAIIRGLQQGVVTWLGSRGIAIDPDSLGAPAGTPGTGLHYNDAQKATLSTMIKAALAAHFSDASWNP